MANTRFSYVKQFEQESVLLHDCWPLIRLDGRSFTNFSKLHKFRKPSDPLALGVMNAAAAHVMSAFDDIVLAYGHSDEYSFLLRKDTRLYNRRLQKILSSVVSAFSSAYCLHWRTFFPRQPLQSLPTFDGRIVLYPRFDNIVDYFSWRHADCHINTQYNICFWCLVSDGKSTDEAYKWLKHTNKGDKNEYIFSSRGINYSKLPRIFRKGTTLVRLSTDKSLEPSDTNSQPPSTPDLESSAYSAAAEELISNAGDRIALTIEESELSYISRKVKELCDRFSIGLLHCDNISVDFWNAVAPSYQNNSHNELERSSPTIAPLRHDQIEMLNTIK